MPFTLFTLRLTAMMLIVLLVAALLNLAGLASLAGTIMVWSLLIGLPVFIAEAFGLLNRAAEFVFGKQLQS